MALQPDLVIIQCAVRWWDLHSLGWAKLRCPIVASCGDALPLCNTAAVFGNLPLLTRLYVEGYDYIDWHAETVHYPSFEAFQAQHSKFRYQQLCADIHFQPLPPEPKIYDWCFLGQAYQTYDNRLKHYRRHLIPALLKECPNGYVSGPHWQEVIGAASRGDWIDQSCLNAIYNKSRVVVSIDAHDGSGYTSTRTIEAMHAGHCTLIYDHPGMDSFKKIVQDGVHALYFCGADDFAEKLKAVKRAPGLAQEVGRAGRALVLDRGWTTAAWMGECLSLSK